MVELTEKDYTLDFVSPPGDSLAEMLEDRGMTQADLARRINLSPKTINEIILGKSAITTETALALEMVLGASAEFWLNRERNYRVALARQQDEQRLRSSADWLKQVPYAEMVNRSWVESSSDTAMQVKSMLQFFGVVSVEQYECQYSQPVAAFHKPATVGSRTGALAAWLRRGEILAQQISCSPYNEAAFKKALDEARKLTLRPFEDVRGDLVQMCAAAGVAVVFVRGLVKSSVYGATRWPSPRKALLQLSFRSNVEDTTWFTFYHEAGHILLHSKREVFIDEMPGSTEVSHDPQKEDEANTFAEDSLIRRRSWDAFVDRKGYTNEQSITAFAREMQIHPGIVLGRLQKKELVWYGSYKHLKRSLTDQPDTLDAAY